MLCDTDMHVKILRLINYYFPRQSLNLLYSGFHKNSIMDLKLIFDLYCIKYILKCNYHFLNDIIMYVKLFCFMLPDFCLLNPHIYILCIFILHPAIYVFPSYIRILVISEIDCGI